jgi:multidrug efflux pump subunit AcrA (membrane-fusion protein)
MMERGKNFLRRFKRPKYWITALILALIVIGIVHRAVSSKAPAFDTATVTRQTVAQEVDATGNVKSAEAVDLAFETGGKVANLAVKVGDRVKAGDRLANLSNADAAANLASAQAKLDQLLQGARPEDLAVSQSSVDKSTFKTR